MKKAARFIAALLFVFLPGTAALAGTPAAHYPSTHYTFDSHDLLFADENGYGYRKLTSAEPASGDALPISNITVYPESDIEGGVEFSYTSEEGPEIQGKNSTIIIRGNIPLPP